MTVPGVTIWMTSRFTIPLADAGSSVCSHMATLYPRSTRRAIYVSAEWNGTPHMGARSSIPQFFPVSVSSNSRDTSLASSKNILKKSPSLKKRMQSLYSSFISMYWRIIGESFCAAIISVLLPSPFLYLRALYFSIPSLISSAPRLMSSLLRT